jgi:hypothetical protein
VNCKEYYRATTWRGRFLLDTATRQQLPGARTSLGNLHGNVCFTAIAIDVPKLYIDACSNALCDL